MHINRIVFQICRSLYDDMSVTEPFFSRVCRYSSSFEHHFNERRIESVLLATGIDEDRVKQIIEWLKHAQDILPRPLSSSSNVGSSLESISKFDNIIDEGISFLPEVRGKISEFIANR